MEEKAANQVEAEQQDKTINLDDLSTNTTKIQLLKQQLFKNVDTTSYQFNNTGDFKGRKFDGGRVYQLVVDGFTPGAEYNILKLDRFGLEVYQADRDKVSLLSCSQLGEDLQKCIDPADTSSRTRQNLLKFAKNVLYIPIISSNSELRNITCLRLSPRTGEISEEFRLRNFPKQLKIYSNRVKGAKTLKNSKIKFLHFFARYVRSKQSKEIVLGFFNNGAFFQDLKLIRSVKALSDAQKSYSDSLPIRTAANLTSQKDLEALSELKFRIPPGARSSNTKITTKDSN